MKNTYAKFWKCALQVNPSTYSEKYRGQNHNYNVSEYAEKLCQICIEEEIKIVGIADHGNVSEISIIRTELNKRGIIVFPGFEITSTEQVHFVCLFPENTTIDNLKLTLGSVGIKSEDFGTNPSSYGADYIIKTVTEKGGFIYAAHCTQDKGILSQLCQHIWKIPNLRAAQIPSTIDSLKGIEDDFYRKVLLNKNKDYERDENIAVINAKDVDTPDALKTPESSCYIKMTNPDFNSFKLAFKDPESRIRLHSQIEEVKYSFIEKVEFSGGYLDGIELGLSSHLNTVIGGRGTGKSTVIECLRYVLGIDPKGKEATNQHNQIIKENLGKESARVELTLISSQQNGKRYKIIRRYGEQPRIIDDQGDVSAMQPKDLLPGIEIYGQNEIYQLAKDNTSILGVIERFIPKNGRQYDKDIKNIQKLLRENAEDLGRIYNRKDEIQEEVNKLPILEEKKKDFQKLGIDEKLKNIPLLEKERQLEEKIDRELGKTIETLQFFYESANNINFLDVSELERLPHDELFNHANSILSGWKNKIEATSLMLKGEFKSVKDSIEEIRENISQEIRKEEDKIESQFGSIPSIAGKTGAEIGVEYKGILKEIARIIPLSDELKSLSEDEDKHLQNRRNLLGKLADLRFDRTNELNNVVKKVSKKLKENVLIEVEMEKDRESLKDFLKNIQGLGPSKLSWVDEAENLTISSLVEAINNGQKTIKDLKWGMTDKVIEILSKISLSDKLALEEIDLKDRISIKLNVSRDGKANFRPLKKLSTGQQCTAILHLLLLQNKEPLIVDQPEDNLDNAFIAERIVKELRAEKTKRQFIFSTHNANIPVFGDAEWIGVLSSNNEKAKLKPNLQGSIDVPDVRNQITDILEGGRDAFIQRKEKYGF